MLLLITVIVGAFSLAKCYNNAIFSSEKAKAQPKSRIVVCVPLNGMVKKRFDMLLLCS